MNADPMASILARETMLPGLSLVLNPARVAETLTSTGLALAEDRLAVDYVRYKPGRRALALLRLGDAASTRMLIVSAYNDAGWQKFTSSGHAQEVLQHDGLVLPDAQCSIAWFPFDRRLKHLRRLIDPARRGRILQTLMQPEHPPEDNWQVNALTYKPGKRFVAQVSDGTQVIAVKCYSQDDFDAARVRAEAVSHAALDQLVARTSACSPRYSMIGWQWLEGETLASQLSAAQAPKQILKETGILLGRWHQQSHRCMSAISARHPGFTVPAISQIIDDISWILPELKPALTQLLNRLEGRLSSLAAANDLVHGDFYAKQILVTPGGLRLIDFDELGRGHRYQDLGNFVGHLVWEATRDGTETQKAKIESDVEAMLSGYEEVSGPIDRSVLAASIATGIIRCLPHAFRRGLSYWPDKMRAMLACARRWLDSANLATNRTRPSRLSEDSSCTYHDECQPYLDVDNIDAHWRSASLQSSDDWHNTRVTAVRLMRYKPGKRLLIEASIERGGQCHESLLIGKARFRKSVDQRVLKLHGDLQSLRSQGVTIPRVVGDIPNLNLWFQEKLVGQSVLQNGQPSMHRSVGAALAALHMSTYRVDRTHVIDDELSTLWTQYRQWLLPAIAWTTRCEAILSSAATLSQCLVPVEPVLLHRDFYFDQVLVLEGRIALLDFDLAAMGPAELDVGNYLAHLDELGLRCQPQHDYCRQAADEFLNGYLALRPKLVPHNVEIWRWLSLARLVAISQRIPTRTHLTEPLLNISQTTGWRLERRMAGTDSRMARATGRIEPVSRNI